MAYEYNSTRRKQCKFVVHKAIPCQNLSIFIPSPRILRLCSGRNLSLQCKCLLTRKGANNRGISAPHSTEEYTPGNYFSRQLRLREQYNMNMIPIPKDFPWKTVLRKKEWQAHETIGRVQQAYESSWLEYAMVGRQVPPRGIGYFNDNQQRATHILSEKS